MTLPVCVVTGAAGAVGPVVVEALVDAGYSVRALSRRGTEVPRATAMPADVTSLESMREAMEGAAAVVHLAALLHINNPPDSMASEYHRVNVGGTENVVRAASEAGARLVQVSTIAVYGYDRGGLITEDVPPEPDTLYARTKLEAETIASAEGAVVLRLAAVYGERLKGNYRRLLDAMHRGRFVALGRGRNRRTLVYERDVARAIVAVLRAPAEVSGQVFNVTDGSVHRVADIITSIAHALGVPRPRLALPVAPIRIAVAGADAVARAVGRRSPVTPSMIDKYIEDVAVSGERIQRVLGFRPEFDLDAGWAETVRALRRSGEL